jgi:hypothetical protein
MSESGRTVDQVSLFRYLASNSGHHEYKVTVTAVPQVRPDLYDNLSFYRRTYVRIYKRLL